MATSSKNEKGTSMNNTSKTILTLAAGAVAGAVTALLLAPQTGSDARRGIRKTVSKLGDDLGSTLQTGMDKITGMGGGSSNGNSASGATSSNRTASSETGRRQTSSQGAGSTSGSSNM